jgi:pimeloyl-ACP methyl ester carboxylesterase
VTLRRVSPTDTAPGWFTSAIAALPTRGEIRVGGATICFRAWGDDGAGAGVVLIHGGAAHAGWWDHVGPLLARGRRVVALDLSGHGDSDRRDTYGLDLWADEALAVAQAVGLGSRPVLIGHSLGGFVALRAATLHGTQLGGVAAIDSPVRDITPEERAARARRAFGPLRVYPTREAVLARFRPVPDDGEPLGYVTDYIAAHSIKAVEGGWSWKFDPRIFGRIPLNPATLHDRACRVALFRAAHGLLSQPMADSISEVLGEDVPVIELPASGHHVMLDQPLALVAALRTLLAVWDAEQSRS